MKIVERIEELNRLLSEIDGKASPKRDLAVKFFLEHIFHLWRAGTEDQSYVDAFVERSLPVIKNRRIDFYISGAFKLQSYINQEFVGNQWTTMCLRRSHIEAFNELYGDFIGIKKFIDTDELDQDIRDKAEYEALKMPDLKPKGLPEGHWWWELD
ncbi:MAG: hypothetical protein K9K67_13255 [Bacteriovoracaceae bacterium]|nr:hypothetical protein [Bacteriovoracaceae bacterium]